MDCTASTWLASRVRSRISAWASSGLSQRVGSSTRAFSSSSLRSAGSQSKTPPEQLDRLLDVGLGGLDIQSHGIFLSRRRDIGCAAGQYKPVVSSCFLGGGGGGGGFTAAAALGAPVRP